MFIRISAAIAAMCLICGAAFAQGTPKPTDSQAAHIAYTAGLIDISAAAMANMKSRNKDVIAFASDMTRNHQAANKQFLDVLKKLNITPEDNETSRLFTKQAADKLSEFAVLGSEAYDRAYVANEIAYNKMVREALESWLIPAATNPELKGALQAGIKVFQEHQQHAEHLAATLKSEANTRKK